MSKRARTTPLPENANEKWSKCANRVGLLLPTASGLLSDWGFLWTIKEFLDGDERPSPGGAYSKNAARRLLTPLHVSCLLKVWVLLFDDSGDSLSLKRIAEAVRGKDEMDFNRLVRAKATVNLEGQSVEEMLSELTDYTRSLQKFERIFSDNRHSFCGHVLERTSGEETVLVDLPMLAKIVPKTIHLVELLGALFGLPPMYLDNTLSTQCLSAAVLFGLQKVAETPTTLFQNRRLSFAKFESIVTEIFQTDKKSRTRDAVQE
jgi:hypothetical protein